jgi:guanylate kinase
LPQRKKQGSIFVISGPSGAGKSSVLALYKKRNPNINLSVSATTRKPRPGEVNMRNYFFVSEDEFKKAVEGNKFLEWAKLYGNYYGTDSDYVDNYLRQGEDVYLEIDVQGAKQVKSKRADAVLIFIAPPSLEELERRLEKRRTETAEDLRKRVELAKEELKAVDIYDHKIENRDLNDSVNQLEKIVEKVKSYNITSDK